MSTLFGGGFLGCKTLHERHNSRITSDCQTSHTQNIPNNFPALQLTSLLLRIISLNSLTASLWCFRKFPYFSYISSHNFTICITLFRKFCLELSVFTEFLSSSFVECGCEFHKQICKLNSANGKFLVSRW